MPKERVRKSHSATCRVQLQYRSAEKPAMCAGTCTMMPPPALEKFSALA